MEPRRLHIQHIVFTLLISGICVMSLVSRDSLNGIYLYFAHILSINPAWVSGDNATSISNGGHIVACFMLTLVAFHVFKQSYGKAVFFVSILACSGEICQSFLLTREAKLEDFLFSCSGILLASILLAALKRSSFPLKVSRR